ncbi:7-carboxy-7-deazaguanine synthase [bioreactor metagenome]|uniref:7-carboxy-7-deazaguanine synthase n=1 Tax=bioreactor metagenome TaxID=1076179 RepID=A0A644ZR38_9ZZZZ|nr:anaerobic ribonucleoside-triphosphate reductase activating protein [Clostridiaceae bacterium]
MNISGFIKTSFVDYPGEIASVVFTQGCNLNCSYCHNAGLIGRGNGTGEVATEEVFHWLSKRKGMIGAVVISGGEPMLQRDINDFAKKLKSRGLRVKLDTNGTDPDALKSLIRHRLLDYIAMDLKAPLCKYVSICRTKDLNLALIKESVEIIKESGLQYEFRTTLCPELESEDVLSIISDFHIASNYVIQNCRSAEGVKYGSGTEKIGLLKQKLQKSLCCTYRGF